MRIYHILLISFILLIAACEKDITVTIPKPTEGLVVEGYIESGKAPYVILTKNSPYFDEVDLNSLSSLLVLDAIVIVSNGSITDTLDFLFNPTQFPFAFYSSNKIIGEYGKSYDLQIIHQNDTLYSTTSIPDLVPIDSLVFEGEKEFAEDSLGYIWVYFSDPAGENNYYKIYGMVLEEDSFFLNPYSSILDDKILNGQLFQFPTYRGMTGTEGAASDTVEIDYSDQSRFMYKVGQKAVIKISSLDVETYLFWKSVETQRSSGGNPFASPSSVFSNIENGLGIWGGYAAAIDTLDIQELNIQ